MKRKPSRHWRPSLKTVLRKSSRVSWGILFFLVSAALLPGQERLAGRLTVDDGPGARGAPLFEIELHNLNRSLLEENLNRGLRAEVYYEYRLLKKNPFLAHRILSREVAQESVRYRLFRDPLTRLYCITSRGRTRSYRDAQRFFDELTLSAWRIPPGPRPGDHYLMARARIEYLQLDPPFSITAYLNPGLRKTSPWISVELP